MSKNKRYYWLNKYRSWEW